MEWHLKTYDGQLTGTNLLRTDRINYSEEIKRKNEK